MTPLNIVSPGTTTEALRALSDEDAVIYAGGTELLPAIEEGLISPTTLVDIKSIEELAGIRYNDTDDCIEIGALVTHTQILESTLIQDNIPILNDVERSVANIRVRNMGTLVGNLCFAEPHSDIAVLTILLNGTVKITGKNSRRIPASEFILGPYETALESNELVESIQFPRKSIEAKFGYARHRGTERPLAAAGVAFTLDGEWISNCRIVVGATGNLPLYDEQINDSLEDVNVNDAKAKLTQIAAHVAQKIDVEDTYEASESYRRHLAGEMVIRAANQAFVY